LAAGPSVAAAAKSPSKAPNGLPVSGSPKPARSESARVSTANKGLVGLSPAVTPESIPAPVPSTVVATVPSSTPNTVPEPKFYTEDFTAPLAWSLYSDDTSIVAFSAARHCSATFRRSARRTATFPYVQRW
jgi:hypothetical protein